MIVAVFLTDACTPEATPVDDGPSQDLGHRPLERDVEGRDVGSTDLAADENHLTDGNDGQSDGTDPPMEETSVYDAADIHQDESVWDGSGEDGNTDEEDPCAGLISCRPDEAGTWCELDDLVTCAQNTDDCYVLTRTDCSLTEQSCDNTGATAHCVDDVVGGDGETCSVATPLSLGTHSFDTTGYSNDYEDYSDAPCSGSSMVWGPDRVFSHQVPVGEILRITVAAGDTSFDVVVAASVSCPDIESSCVGYADDWVFLEPESFGVENDTGADAILYIVVAGWSSSDYGPFQITLEYV